VIRLATVADAAQIAAIYAPFCRDSAISFEEAAPSAEEMAERVVATLERFPWFVYDSGGGDIWGYAYASRHRDRPAYRWSVEVSCYVRADRFRQGVGRSLYAALFEMLTTLGYFNACAGIALPNPASVALHESLGFVPVGIYPHIGFKRGAWHDVGWWQKQLRPPAADPKSPRSLPELENASTFTIR
jgi:L-amino acid N-acyltransferase YncA